MRRARRRKGASAGTDGLTIGIVKVSATGNVLSDSTKKALGWAKERTPGATQHTAQGTEA